MKHSSQKKKKKGKTQMLDVVAVSKKKGKIFIFNENFTEKKIFVEPVNNA